MSEKTFSWISVCGPHLNSGRFIKYNISWMYVTNHFFVWLRILMKFGTEPSVVPSDSHATPPTGPAERVRHLVHYIHEKQRSSQRKSREHLNNLPSHPDNATHQGNRNITVFDGWYTAQKGWQFSYRGNEMKHPSASHAMRKSAWNEKRMGITLITGNFPKKRFSDTL